MPKLLPILILPLLILNGCFAERSFPMVPSQLITLESQTTNTPHPTTLPTRSWVDLAHQQLHPALPTSNHKAITSSTALQPNGQSLNAWAFFNIPQNGVDSIWFNLPGIEQTAQVVSPPPGEKPAPMWKGFHEVSVPVGRSAAANLELYGRLGIPEPADEIPGSYIIITHGLFGSLEGLDMENHVQALRKMGHHVLAIEMRGHGQTCLKCKEAYVTFGITEVGDLLRAAQWLKTQHKATRVGLVSFSLSGFASLLAAWEDGGAINPTDWKRLALRETLPPTSEPAFNAGMFVVSVPTDVVATAARFDKRYELLDAPVKATFQNNVQKRLKSFNEPQAYTMWAFVEAELRRGKWPDAYGSYDAMKQEFLWLTNWKGNGDWAPGIERMETARHPVLVLAAANDPLGTGQENLELFSRVKNPNVGLILLKGGGHMGFSALSADYYYSLMRAFFDPQTAPATSPIPTLTLTGTSP